MPPKKDKEKEPSPTLTSPTHVLPADQHFNQMLGCVGEGDRRALYLVLESVKIDRLPPLLKAKLLSGQLRFATHSSTGDRRDGGTEGVENLERSPMGRENCFIQSCWS